MFGCCFLAVFRSQNLTKAFIVKHICVKLVAEVLTVCHLFSGYKYMSHTYIHT